MIRNKLRDLYIWIGFKFFPEIRKYQNDLLTQKDKDLEFLYAELGFKRRLAEQAGVGTELPATPTRGAYTINGVWVGPGKDPAVISLVPYGPKEEKRDGMLYIRERDRIQDLRKGY